MTSPAGGSRSIRVHATNITGEGASHLVQSLLPAIERARPGESSTVYLPNEGPLSEYESSDASTRLMPLRRLLPNSLSRVMECTIFAGQFAGNGPLLVLGDIPLRCRGYQAVFVQTPLLTNNSLLSRNARQFKYRIARMLFRLNARFATAFIVQTPAMKRALVETYPQIAGRIHVVGQPPPGWLLAKGLKRTGRAAAASTRLNLFYPAASYPHKNHGLLAQMNVAESVLWPVRSLTLTLDETLHPNPAVSWMRCVGRLSPEQVMTSYAETDALLFLSLTESFGFPLVEAMWIGLPIICPDLPYSRNLCGNDAIYFDPRDVGSLRGAIVELARRLHTGWWPNWSAALEALPESWDAVATLMLEITDGRAPVARIE